MQTGEQMSSVIKCDQCKRETGVYFHVDHRITGGYGLGTANFDPRGVDMCSWHCLATYAESRLNPQPVMQT